MPFNITSLYKYIWLIIVLGMAFCAYLFFWPQLNIHQLEKHDTINLPTSLKQRLLTDPESELLYIDYKDNKLNYFYISQNRVRLKTILRTLRRMNRLFMHRIPEGHYLFVLHDALPHTYDIPVLAFAANIKYVDSKNVVLIPDTFAMKGYHRLFWKMYLYSLKYSWDKKYPKVLFRGSATGVGYEHNTISGFPRLEFMNYSKNLDFVDAGFSSYTNQLNQSFRDYIASIHSLKDTISPSQSQAYKYLIDIDGNTCSFSRMAWILHSNSLLLKHESPQVQWYYHLLVPYHHYLPIDKNFSNLHDQVMLAEENPLRAKLMVKNSHNLAKKIFHRRAILKSLHSALVEYNSITQQ